MQTNNNQINQNTTLLTEGNVYSSKILPVLNKQDKILNKIFTHAYVRLNFKF